MWHPQRSERASGALGLEERLVEESELFLSGRLAPAWAHDGRAVPGWAWLSTLAHASPETIRWLSWHASDLSTGARRWGEDVGFAANLLCAIADTGGPGIEELQHGVIVPLELRGLHCAALTPEGLVRLVVSSLRRVGS